MRLDTFVELILRLSRLDTFLSRLDGSLGSEVGWVVRLYS